ncbi:zinc finger domain-containing protein [Streptomyces chartreusis]
MARWVEVTKGGGLQEDKRRIQTAVLGDAASEVPLLLPLEAIEVDAFRQEHAGDTFWCGLLLGGCGGQLTTKLYTDRVCHYAHHPDPDGLPQVCGRRARDVASADHLYFKAAALAWLAGRGERARFTFTQPDGLPIGSLLDIAFEREGRTLRVHLDQAITPEWNDEAVEPVLGMSVPVDDDTLIRRWYVHRVRFDSQGTSRQVRIGTAAFTRPTEWFGLDDCEMTDEGLRTPAVDRIIRSRRTPPPRQVAFSHASATDPGKVVGQDERVRRLRDALRTGSVPAVTTLCQELDTDPRAEEELAEVLSDAHRRRTAPRSASSPATSPSPAPWPPYAFLERQRERRGDLVQQLRKAVAERSPSKVRSLLVQVETAVGHDRSKDEDEAIRTAGTFIEDQKRNASWAHRDKAPAVRGPKFSRSPTPARPRTTAPPSARPDPAAAAHHRMRDLLSDLRRLAGRLPEREINRMIGQLKKSADAAGDHVTALQREEVDSWSASTHDLYPAAPEQDPQVLQAQAAQRRVRASLRNLRRLPHNGRPLTRETRRRIKELQKDLADAGDEATPAQRRAAHDWIARLDEQTPPHDASRPSGQHSPSRTREERSDSRTGGRTRHAERQRLSEAKITEVAAAVRGALKKAARERTTTSWSRLRRQLGSAVPHHLHPDDQVAVLTQADADTPADEPLLTALIAANDPNSASVFQQVASQLGRTVPEDTQAARSQWQTDALNLQQLYRYK